MLSLSDDLAQLDIHFEAVLKNQSNQFYLLLSYFNQGNTRSDAELKISEQPLSSPFMYRPSNPHPNIDEPVLIDSPSSFLESFKWNGIKYRPDTPLADLIVLFSSEVKQLETVVKGSISNFQNTAQRLYALKKKQHGSLAVKSLATIVPPLPEELENSEFMQRLLLVVPFVEEEAFLANYEHYAPLVVPRSASYLTFSSLVASFVKMTNMLSIRFMYLTNI